MLHFLRNCPKSSLHFISYNDLKLPSFFYNSNYSRNVFYTFYIYFFFLIKLKPQACCTMCQLPDILCPANQTYYFFTYCFIIHIYLLFRLLFALFTDRPYLYYPAFFIKKDQDKRCNNLMLLIVLGLACITSNSLCY